MKTVLKITNCVCLIRPNGRKHNYYVINNDCSENINKT